VKTSAKVCTPLLLLLALLLVAGSAWAQGGGKRSDGDGGGSDSDPDDGSEEGEQEEEDEDDTARKRDPASQIGEILTQPIPPATTGPNWLDPEGNAPRRPPGRKHYRPDKFLDVLYLRNGNILRGHLVNEEFPDHFAMCVSGSSVVLVPEKAVMLRTKERPVHANRSHRAQIGLAFAPSFGGGLCVSLDGACTDSEESVMDFAGVPASLKYQLAATIGLSSAIDFTVGAYFRKSRTLDATVVDAVIGIRHYSAGPDVVKFVRMGELQFGFKPEFAMRVAVLTGVQVDPVRNAGIYVALGPELEFIRRFVLGFSAQVGVQGRFP
jgi:hypothetical protein